MKPYIKIMSEIIYYIEVVQNIFFLSFSLILLIDF